MCNHREKQIDLTDFIFANRNTCRGLFEQHKLLFSFHMCVKILDAQGKIIPGEYAFLLRGGIVLDRENQPDKPVPWLPDETWDNITELDKLPGFHGLVSSFEQLPRDWLNWCVQRHILISSRYFSFFLMDHSRNTLLLAVFVFKFHGNVRIKPRNRYICRISTQKEFQISLKKKINWNNI